MPIHDMRNRWNTYVEHFRQTTQRVRASLVRWSVIPMTLIQSPDFANVGARQLARIAKTFWNKEPTSLCERIFLIIARRSKEQVIRAYAWRIVAAMQYPQVFWNCTEMQLPRKSVSKNKPWLSRACEFSIASVMDRSAPEPTGFRFLDSTPETSSECFMHEGGRF